MIDPKSSQQVEPDDMSVASDEADLAPHPVSQIETDVEEEAAKFGDFA